MTTPGSRAIPPSTVLAYRATIYEIEIPGNGGIAMRVGTVNRPLSALMAAHSVGSVAFLTAFNPYSRCTEDEVNRAEQARMEADLRARGFSYLLGAGRDPSGQWPSEVSVLVLGMLLPEAEATARAFGQNGFVWVGSAEGLVVLRLLRPLQIPNADQLQTWRASLLAEQGAAAALLSPREQAALMTVPATQFAHWLFPDRRDLTMPWPLTLPNGSTMGAGTELDRMFRWVSAGLTETFTEYVDSPDGGDREIQDVLQQEK